LLEAFQSDKGNELVNVSLNNNLLTAAGSVGAGHYGTERREAQATQALRWLREELDGLGWDAGALRRARKGDERKARIRTETTLSLKWMAEHFAMGSWTHVSNLLGAKRKRKFKK